MKYLVSSFIVSTTLLLAGCIATQPVNDANTNVNQADSAGVTNTAVETNNNDSATTIKTTNTNETTSVDETDIANDTAGNTNDDIVTDVDTSDWLMYTNEEYGFSLEYPKKWEYVEQQYECIDFISQELRDHNVEWVKNNPEAAMIGTDAVKTYDISVCYEENNQNLTIDEWVEENVNFDWVISQESTTIGAQPGIEVVKNVLGVWRETYMVTNKGIVNILRLQDPVALDSVSVEEIVSTIYIIK